MKKLFFLFPACCIILTSACKNKADKQHTETDNTNTDLASAWTATLNDSSGRLQMKKNGGAGPDSQTASSVIKFLNTQNSNIQLEVVKQSTDTLFIKIPDAMYLTQQMGSTGSTMYIATAVYNLTDIPGINFINFDFEEGDHASPGTYTRDSFKDE